MPERSRPEVSIIMPAYNAARFIEDAIRSVQAQTLTDWELLIIDDASADNTGEIVSQLQQKDARILYHRVERIGSPAGVRNAGLKRAQGRFIAFLDADDLYYPDTLERLRKALLADETLSAVYGFSFSMNEDG